MMARFSPRGPRGISPPFLRGESVQSLNKIHLFRSLRGPSQLRGVSPTAISIVLKYFHSPPWRKVVAAPIRSKSVKVRFGHALENMHPHPSPLWLRRRAHSPACPICAQSVHSTSWLRFKLRHYLSGGSGSV